MAHSTLYYGMRASGGHQRALVSCTLANLPEEGKTALRAFPPRPANRPRPGRCDQLEHQPLFFFIKKETRDTTTFGLPFGSLARNARGLNVQWCKCECSLGVASLLQGCAY